MKPLLCKVFVFWFLLSGSMPGAEKSKYLTAGWLEKGCLAILVEEKDPSNWTKDQERTASLTVAWINGFLVGVNGSTMLYTQDARSPLSFPPDEWLNAAVASQELLQYMRRNERIFSPEIPARVLILSWYLDSHPEATQGSKFAAKNLLITETKKVSAPVAKRVIKKP